MLDKKRVPRDAFDIELAGGDCLYLIITAIAFFILVFIIERLRNKQALSSILTR